MYVNIPDDYMDVPMRSEGVSFIEKRRKQDDMSSCCHSVEEGLHVHKLGEVMGNNCFLCSAFFIHAHGHGGCITCHVAPVDPAV